MTTQALHEKLDAIFNAHLQAELAGDLDETLATMSPDPHLVNVPTMVSWVCSIRRVCPLLVPVPPPR